MTRLQRVVPYNSFLRVNFSFIENGVYYLPISIQATLLAIPADSMAEYPVVNNFYDRDIAPQSQVAVNLTDLDLAPIDGTTTRRLLVLRWRHLSGGSEVTSTEQVEFELEPLPVIANPPPAPVPVPPAIEVLGVALGGVLPTSSTLTVNFSVPMDSATFGCSVTDDSGADLILNWYLTAEATAAVLNIAQEMVSGVYELHIAPTATSLAGAVYGVQLPCTFTI